MYERKSEALAPFPKYLRRLIKHIIIGCLIIAFGLCIGMVGYHITEDMPWIDAFVNASMILSSMGPMTPLQSTSGKLFAGFYALFSGLAFITIVGVVSAPIIHRALHKFHLQ